MKASFSLKIRVIVYWAVSQSGGQTGLFERVKASSSLTILVHCTGRSVRGSNRSFWAREGLFELCYTTLGVQGGQLSGQSSG